MARVVEYDKHYNINHWEYWWQKYKSDCAPGQIIDGCLLVLSEESSEYSWRLVDLQIVKTYEHNNVLYSVKEIGCNKYKISKMGDVYYSSGNMFYYES